MKNIYDNEKFFESYSQMNRSQQGLDGAGEWQTLKRLLPDFKKKRVLDLGCGYGWHCLYAAEHGAASVIGVDISEKMLEVARKKNTFDNICYLHDNIDKITFEPNSFDVIISSLAIHYIEDFKKLAKIWQIGWFPADNSFFPLSIRFLRQKVLKTGFMMKMVRLYTFLSIIIFMKESATRIFSVVISRNIIAL